MTMPTPEEILKQIEEDIKKQPTSAPQPAAAAPRPAGTEVSPGRIISPNGLTTYMYNSRSGEWEPSPYPPSAADKAAAGIGGSSTTSSTPRVDYTAQKSQQQVAAGGSPNLPAGAYQIAPTRAVDASGLTIWTKDPTTGNWTNAGFPPNTADKQAAMRVAAETRSAGGASTSVSPRASESLRGPSLPGMPDTTTRTLPSSVNNVAIQNPNTGFSGFINRSPGNTAPRSLGYGPAVSTNTITFNQNERGFTQAANPIAGSYTFPSWMDPLTGRTDAGFAAPATIGVTTGALPTTFQEMVAGTNTTPIQLAGPNVTYSAPDKSWGTGFVLDALPHSNIALAQGRDFSGLSPQGQAAATFMLLDDQMNNEMSGAYRTADGAYIFGGGGESEGGIGWSNFAKGGRVMAGMHMMPDGSMMRGPMMMAGGGRAVSSPLGGRASTSGPKLMVTPEQMYLVGKSGKVYATMGEDNADPDRRPDRELLMLHGPRNATMDIVPLEPFAQGGRVQADQMSPAEIAMMLRARMAGLSGRPELEGAPPTGRVFAWYPGFAEGGTVTAAPAPPTGSFKTRPNGEIYWDPGTPVVDTPAPTAPEPTPTAPTPSGPVAPSTPPVGDISIDNPPPPPPLPEENVGFDIFDPNILAPWEAEARRNAWREHLRQTIDEPRRRAAGFIPGTSTAIEVLQGDAPTEALGPGAYYSTDSQVNRVIGEILGAQADYRALGPEEDVTPVRERATYLGNAIDDFARIRQLEDARVAAQAGGNVPSVDPSVIADLQAQLAELGQQIGAAEHGLTLYPDPTGTGKAHLNQLYEQRNELEQRIKDAQKTGLNVADKVSVIDAQIASIRSRLPAGASEADVRTELARLNERIQRQDKRVGLSKQVANLQKLGVPSLNGPIVPVKSPNAPGRLVAEP